MSIFEEYGAFNANSIGPEQTPHSAASHLDPQSLQMCLLWDIMHK